MDLEKTKFWDKHRMDGLNQRQIEVIEHFITPENNEKPITTKRDQYVFEAEV